MQTLEPVLLAAAGGLATQLLLLLELQNIPKNSWPDFKSIATWLPYIIAPLFGALIGYCYFCNENDFSQQLLSVHVGASAPLILRQMASSLPKA